MEAASDHLLSKQAPYQGFSNKIFVVLYLC
jgi:hypothetical protein